MGCLGNACRKIFIGILSLLKVGVCITIICIVAIHLLNVYVPIKDGGKSVLAVQCLMSGNVNGSSVCDYTFAVCGISMFVSFVTSILLCITCDLCGIGAWLEFIIGVFQTAWWVIASIVISNKVKETNDFKFPNGTSLPDENWRNAVAVLAWVNVLLAALMTVLYLCEACKCLKECCSCCGGSDDDDGRKSNAV